MFFTFVAKIQRHDSQQLVPVIHSIKVGWYLDEMQWRTVSSSSKVLSIYFLPMNFICHEVLLNSAQIHILASFSANHTRNRPMLLNVLRQMGNNRIITRSESLLALAWSWIEAQHWIYTSIINLSFCCWNSESVGECFSLVWLCRLWASTLQMP